MKQPIANMKHTRNLMVVLFFCLAITKDAFSQSSLKSEVEAIRERIIETHSINIQALQGIWKAYNGIFKFNGSVNSMALTTPMVLEFKDDQYRTDLKGTFKRFTLTKNYFEAQEGTWHGYINSISDNVLVITLNSGENRTRYYYEK